MNLESSVGSRKSGQALGVPRACTSFSRPTEESRLNITFAPKAWDSYLYWKKTDKATLKRINILIKDIQRNPFEGIGKPEPLKHTLSGYYSRRINNEHRIVYKVTADSILIAQLRYHY